MNVDQLSPHFSLAELTRTSVPIDNGPGANAHERLVRLACDFLEPLRAQFGPLLVTSGYRSPALQEELRRRGRPTAQDSAHCYGCAADLVPVDPSVSLDAMVAWLSLKSRLPFDQVILEHAGTDDWIHLGMLRPNHEAHPRRQVLRFDNGTYSVWVPSTAVA